MIWFKWLFISICVHAADTTANTFKMKDHAPPARAEQCQFCHTDKQSKFVSKKNHTELEHSQNISQHGGKILACNFCHDKGNHNFLKSTAAFPASFSNPSPVCQQCHEEEFRDWKKGIHGKRIGGWKGDDRQQLHCIECHDPHSVKFKSLKAKPAPKRPKLGIPKDE